MHFWGLAYRAHNPRWASEPLSGEGARRNGGRFNRPGRAAFYAALSQRGAITEAMQELPFGAPMQPLTLCAYQVDAAPVFDARDAEQRRRHGVSASALRCPNWKDEAERGLLPESQALAERLIAAGFCGMRVQSFARGAGAEDCNLVLWRWGGAPPCSVTLIDNERRLG